MDISMSMLESYLRCYDIESDIQDDELSIHGMRFIAEGRHRSSREYVYIGQALDYLKDAGYADALILASGKSHIVCRGSDYEELLNAVLSAFEFYNGIDEKLLHAAAAHRPLDEMLDVLSEVFVDSFLVFGMDGVLLGAINFDQVPLEVVRESIDKHGSLGALAIGGYYVDAQGNVMHDLTDDARVSFGDDGAAVNRYFSQDGERVGFVMCFPSSENTIGLAVCLETLFVPYLAQAREFTDGSSLHQAHHLALTNLVNGATVPDEVVDRLLAGVGTEGELHLVLAQSLVVRNRTQRLLLANEIEASDVPCVSCEVGDFVVFLVAAPHLEALVEQIQRRFDAKGVAIGVSMSMADARQAPKAYRQALFACETNGGPGVGYCRDMALPFLLQVLANEPDVLDLLHPAIPQLGVYDAKTGSELLDTLRSYVMHGCNQADCARYLHVHLNTLKYRLKRVQELTGLDYKDAEDMFYLQLSFALM